MTPTAAPYTVFHWYVHEKTTTRKMRSLAREIHRDDASIFIYYEILSGDVYLACDATQAHQALTTDDPDISRA